MYLTALVRNYNLALEKFLKQRRCSMSTALGSPNTTSTELWKFFEQRGTEQKESMIKLVTWIVGFAAVVLGFAVKEGFDKDFAKVAHRGLLFVLGFVGLVLLAHAAVVIKDHGRHINRTFARADAARDGVSVPREIWK